MFCSSIMIMVFIFCLLQPLFQGRNPVYVNFQNFFFQLFFLHIKFHFFKDRGEQFQNEDKKYLSLLLFPFYFAFRFSMTTVRLPGNEGGSHPQQVCWLPQFLCQLHCLWPGRQHAIAIKICRLEHISLCVLLLPSKVWEVISFRALLQSFCSGRAVVFGEQILPWHRKLGDNLVPNSREANEDSFFIIQSLLD